VNTTSTANPGGCSATRSLPAFPYALSRQPYKAGVKPSALVPTHKPLSLCHGFRLQRADRLHHPERHHARLPHQRPFKTGNEPNAICIDPRGFNLYITNGLDSSVSAYVILWHGNAFRRVNVTGSQANTTDTTPVAVIVDPALGRYVYTATTWEFRIGFRLNPTTGALTPTQTTPYPTGLSRPHWRRAARQPFPPDHQP